MLRCPKCKSLAVVRRNGGPHFDNDVLCQGCTHAWEPQTEDSVDFIKVVEDSLGIRYYDIEKFADLHRQLVGWAEKEARNNPIVGLDLSPGDGDCKTRDRLLGDIRRLKCRI